MRAAAISGDVAGLAGVVAATDVDAAAWLAAAEAGDPRFVLLLEGASRKRPLSASAWLRILARTAPPAAREGSRGRVAVFRQALASALRSATKETGRARGASGRMIAESIETLLSDLAPHERDADLVALLTQALVCGLPFVTDAAAVALYRIGNTGGDVSAAVDALLQVVPGASSWTGDVASMDAVSALTVFAAQGPRQRERVEDACRRSTLAPGSYGMRPLRRAVETGDVHVPAFERAWTSALAFPDAPYLVFGTSRQRVSSAPGQTLCWSMKGHPRRDDWYQPLRAFLESGRPPLDSGFTPPASVLRDVLEIVGGIAFARVSSAKARLAERLRARALDPPPACGRCSELGVRQAGTALPPAAENLDTLARNADALAMCAACGALFLVERSWDNAYNAPDVDYVVSRIDAARALEFLGEAADEAPWVVIAEP